MRLIYVTATMPFGVGEEFLIDEARELLRQGVELLIVPRSPAGEILHEDAKCLEQPWGRKRSWSPTVLAVAGGQALRHPFRLLKIIRLLAGSHGCTIFLKNMAMLAKGLWLGQVAKHWRADHIHAHWALTTATLAMIAAEWSGVPWSFTAHRGDVVQGNLLAAKTAKASFTRYICRTTMNIAAEQGADIRSIRAAVIHMGVVLPAATTTSPRRSATPIVLCPADLRAVKGHAYLLQAIALLKQQAVECTLRLVGRGALRQQLQRQADKLSLGSTVEFLGAVPHQELLSWYGRGEVDVVVLPSVDLGDHCHEGVPVALMEAMAYGVPVVSTATGGIPELLHDGAGILVPPRDPAALADAIERLIRDLDLRTQLGAAGRRRVEEHFSVERVVAELTASIEAADHRSRTNPSNAR